MLQSPAVWIAVGYLLGSIPFGLLLARGVGIDIRSVGSGNIGATNVLRTGNKGLAAATLVLDAAKGFAAVWLGRHAGGNDLAAYAGFAAFLGHLFPIWLGFRGGKGVATLLGVTLGLAWPVGVAALLVWLLGAVSTRYSSVGGMLAALVGPVWLLVAAQFGWALPFTSPAALLVPYAMALLLLWKHRDNVARLRDGTESKIGAKA